MASHVARVRVALSLRGLCGQEREEKEREEEVEEEEEEEADETAVVFSQQRVVRGNRSWRPCRCTQLDHGLFVGYGTVVVRTTGRRFFVALAGFSQLPVHLKVCGNGLCLAGMWTAPSRVGEKWASARAVRTWKTGPSTCPYIGLCCSVSSPEEYRKIAFFLALLTLEIWKLFLRALVSALTRSVSEKLDLLEMASGRCSVFCTMLDSTADTTLASVSEAFRRISDHYPRERGPRILSVVALGSWTFFLFSLFLAVTCSVT